MKSYNNPLISVIVPVYNTERYLPKCIKSIVNQSYHNIELILVDDGSTDDSGRICDYFAQRDDRVTVLHPQNGGVSAARNLGLKTAKGEYVCFVDSDDWIPKGSIEQLAEGIIKSNADLVVGKIKLINALRNGDYGLLHGGTISRDAEYKWYETLSNINPGPCAKLYERSIIHDNNIQFPINIKWGEDTVFVYSYLSHCNTINILNTDVYCYNKLNESSATTNMTFKNLSEWAVQIVKLYCEMNYDEKSAPSKDSVAVITKRYFNWSCGHYARMEGLKEAEAKKEIEKTISLFIPIIELAEIRPYNETTSDDRVFCLICEDNASEKIYNYYNNTKDRTSNGIISSIKNSIRSIAKSIKLKWYFGG